MQTEFRQYFHIFVADEISCFPLMALIAIWKERLEYYQLLGYLVFYFFSYMLINQFLQLLTVTLNKYL